MAARVFRRWRYASESAVRVSWTSRCRAGSIRRAPVRAMLSRSAPSDARIPAAWARYWRPPLTRMPMAVTATKAAPSRHPRRRHTGSRLPRGTMPAEAVPDPVISGPLLLVDGQLRHVALEEQLDRPVQDDADPRGEGRQLQHVDRLPEEPRRKPDELPAHEVRDGRPPRERHHLAEELEAEGLPLLARQARLDLRGQGPPLTDRHLRRRDVRLSRMGVGLRRVVTQGVDARPALDLEESIDEDATVLRPRDIEPRDHRAHPVPRRPDDAAAADEPAVRQVEPVRGHARR